MFDISRVDYMNDNYAWQSDPEATFVQDDSDPYGLTYDLLFNRKTNQRTILVVFDGIPNPPQMAHEAFHVMNGILKEVDLGFDFGNNAGNEHMAYIIEWAVNCMCKAIEKEKKCKKKTK